MTPDTPAVVTKLDVAALTAPMQAVHDSCQNFTYEWRLVQLEAMGRMLRNHRDEWTAALCADLGKHRVEAVAMELLMVQNDLRYTLQNLQHRWMPPEPIPSPGLCAPAFSRLAKRPLLGPAVLIIGPFNYPVSLVLHPAIGALAAGNPVVCKPSELTPTVAALFVTLIARYFDASAVVCVAGGVAETTALLSRPWGRIFFTGSPAVGKIVARAAADTLTPVTLELGGKAPCYIDADTCPADFELMANRIVWSKTVNAGQTCAAPDTLIVHEALLPRLLPALRKSLRGMFGDDPRATEFGRIVSPRHAERLVAMIAQVEELIARRDKTITPASEIGMFVAAGGSSACDAAARYVAPTIVVNPPRDSSLMREEIFGPILPIVTVKSRRDAVDYMRNMPGTPLCLYVFTTSEAVFDRLIQQVPAGSVMRNDCLVHLSSPYIPFGGLGTSGYGAYHGKFSFDLFSHTQPVMYRPCIPGCDLNMIRCHPFGKVKGYIMTNIVVGLPPIPVLHIRFVLKAALLLVTAGLFWTFMPAQFRHKNAFLYRPFLEALAGMLESGAHVLRQSCSRA